MRDLKYGITTIYHDKFYLIISYGPLAQSVRAADS